MDHSLRLQLLFARYLQRNCTPQELEELMALLHEAQAQDALEQPMQELWDQLKNDRAEHETDWENMVRRIKSTEEPVSIPANRGRGNRLKWYALAATVLLIVSAMVYWFGIKDTGQASQPQLANTTTGKTTENMRQTIHLPDGSTVVLNANSKLNYPASFTGKTREVYLTGEGYFDIKHDPGQPFLVHSGKITTRVLGTAFNIKAYASAEIIEVTVTRGKVQVMKEDKNLALINANQQVSFNNRTEQYAQKVVDTKPVTAWKPAEILFNDITMKEAADQVAARFKVDIDFANPAVKNCRVTATFSEDDLVDEMLAVICAVSNAEYTITQNKILIDGKGCK
jgi:ferric-dicitrate binding protein FerR (iron transport regulator)